MTNDRNSIPRPLCDEDRRLLHDRLTAGYNPDRMRPRDCGLAIVGAILFVAFAWLSFAVWLAQ